MTVQKFGNADYVLSGWKRDPAINENITAQKKTLQKEAIYSDFPVDLHPDLVHSLQSQGISQLYSHQLESWEKIKNLKNVVITTGTASGKTLCYNLSVLDRLIRYPDSRALYIFPTKALAQDQKAKLDELAVLINKDGKRPLIRAEIYDGDTSPHKRSAIRKNANIILSNPDMLHQAILPHHTNWASFLQNLDFVIIDETHIYRGVFGSHVANLVRRLKRILAFYGNKTQFILTSATIGNPDRLAENIVEETVFVINQDGSPKSPKSFLLYNPPITQKEFNIRRSPMAESTRLAADLLENNIQTLIFAKSRRGVELLLKDLIFSFPNEEKNLFAYRSGYLAQKRREIENNLRTGKAKIVVATNALELGIDVGGVGAIIMIGYQGTIAATRQQAGRAGRKDSSSLVVLIASSNPIDQFIMNNPEFLFENNPENALVNPNNILILLQHLQCAAFELPFEPEEIFGNLQHDLQTQLLKSLTEANLLYESRDKFFWGSDIYPASTVSLRTSGENTILLRCIKDNKLVTIGEVDESSAYWLVHPEAIYLQEGKPYFVGDLDLEKKTAVLQPVEVDYYTSPIKNVTLEKLNVYKSQEIPGGTKYLGEIMVSSQVNAFRRILWDTREILETKALEMPETKLRTIAYWLALSDELVDNLRQLGIWTGDANNYGPNWTQQRNLARERDNYRCQICGLAEQSSAHHVHHKTPFKKFTTYQEANRLDNLITLCSNCHQKAEMSVRVNSGLTGLGNILGNISPLLVMCDMNDLGIYTHPQSPITEKQPCIAIYDHIPAGIGLSEGLYDKHTELLNNAHSLISNCPCQDGCPSCVGAPGEYGVGSKLETLAILDCLLGK